VYARLAEVRDVLLLPRALPRPTGQGDVQTGCPLGGQNVLQESNDTAVKTLGDVEDLKGRGGTCAFRGRFSTDRARAA